jgi:flagellin
MTRINTNIVSLQAQINLQDSQRAEQTSLTRLSTGLQINSGADNPSGLIAANTLGAEITSINASISNSQTAVNVLSTVDAALSQVSTLLNNVRGLVQQSANSGAISSSQIAANQVQLDSALSSISRIGQTTEFGGESLLNGSKAFNVTGNVSGVFASSADVQVNAFDPSAAQAGAGNDVTVSVSQAATKKTVNLVGDSQLAGGTSSLRNLSLGTSTRATSTLVTNAGVISAGGAGLNNLTTDSTAATRTITGASLSSLTPGGSNTNTVTLSVAGNLGTQSITVNVAAIQANSSALATAINNVSAQTGVVATTAGGAAADLTLTSTAVGTSAAANVTATAATVAGDVASFNGAVGSLTAGTYGAGAVSTARSTVFTITGNKGSATIDTANLVNGSDTGNDVIINNASGNAGIQKFADLINTRTNSTGVTASVNSSGNLVLTSGGVGANSIASIDVATAGNDKNTVDSLNTRTATAGITGVSNTTTVQLTGDLGSATITFNNDQVINDSSVLAQAINRVTTQTGISASTSGGNLADVTLSSQNYGSAAQVTFNAISGTNASDITLLNGTGTQQSTAGQDIAGTVATSKGTGTFTGTGATINYQDSAVSLTGTANAAAAQPTYASTTIVGSTGGSGGLSNITGTGASTITFQLTGKVNGTTVNTNVTVNAAALKADSRVLIDAINKTTQTSGVKAALANPSGATALGNIVLTSSTAGAAGQVSITATAATVAGDATAFNNAATQTNTKAGLNAPASATASFDVTGGTLFQIGPSVNYENQVTANIQGLDLNTLGRNILTTGTQALSSLLTGGLNSLSSSNLSNAASIVEQAISQISTLRGQLGALQTNVLQSNITSQQATLEQVTSAQSNIQDTNFAAETANLTRAQILVQAGTSVLQIANTAPQQVLSLLPKG